MRTRPTWSLRRHSTEQAGWVHNRLRVEALFAAAAAREPPPIQEVLPDPLLRDELPEELPWLVWLLPSADVDLQDEVEVALHPTLTRVWCRTGRRGQRLVEAPGNTAKEDGFGLVDGRDGWFDWRRAPTPSRRALPGAWPARAGAAGQPGHPHPRGARAWCARCWRTCAVSWCWSTPRPMLPPLLEDADAWARTSSPTDILRQLGSPFADAPSSSDHELTHAA